MTPRIVVDPIKLSHPQLVTKQNLIALVGENKGSLFPHSSLPLS